MLKKMVRIRPSIKPESDPCKKKKITGPGSPALEFRSQDDCPSDCGGGEGHSLPEVAAGQGRGR